MKSHKMVTNTGGHEPSSGFIEDTVANTVAGLFSRSQYRYDREKGRLRTYLRTSPTPAPSTGFAKSARSTRGRSKRRRVETDGGILLCPLVGPL